MVVTEINFTSILENFEMFLEEIRWALGTAKLGVGKESAKGNLSRLKSGRRQTSTNQIPVLTAVIPGR